MDKYKIKDLAERLQKEETTELKNKMLFMWTKQEVINLKEYNELVKLTLTDVSQQRELLLAYEKSQYETTWWMSEAEATNRINDFLANNCG